MLEFRNVLLEDKKWIDPLYKINQFRSCEFSFANLYIWHEQYHTQIANVDGFFVAKSAHSHSFSFPIGDGTPKPIIEKLMKYADEEGFPFRLRGLCEGAPAALEEMFPGKFEFSADRAYSDYIYSAESLSNLTGKKLSAKRNHINNFLANHPVWQFEPITEDNIKECQEMTVKWCQMNNCKDDPEKQKELKAVQLALNNMDTLNLKGGLIRLEKDVIAFSIGEPLTDDTFVVHIEKTFSDIQGAYPIINREFVRYYAKDYTYVNREEDLGVPGLRKAKLSYRPVILLDKYEAVLKN
ncbi:DUF2156 domain-containing protein [Scatolibacter rhodanostii]|uniref:DUF2156 domain-containing protein n=1 Tax=Scatolibacter rhodanostii TaxID=2014781 RepID=UPI000C077655|nr:phosphatidylglycerol lysyltransferase domain-containing protein [Scatolibacter rhodanostii]